MVDIAGLADDELRERLREYGVNVGPVTSTTRLFYEKKLGKLIESGGSPAPPPASESEEEEEEEEEDEEVQINYRHVQQEAAPPPQRAQPRVQKSQTYTTRTEPVQVKQVHTPIIQPRSASTSRGAVRRNVAGNASSAQATKVQSKEPKQGGGGGIGMWLKLLFIAIVAILIYLVIVNMNPSAENKIPFSL